MTRVNLLLVIAVLASAFYLVKIQYESRRLYTEFDRARSEARNLELERERLEVDRRSQGTSLRVEKVAKEELHMRSVTPAITQYIYRPQEGAKDGSAVSSVNRPTTQAQESVKVQNKASSGTVEQALDKRGSP